MRPQESEEGFTNVIKTDLANCMDCYRCVRACPVKAIGVNGGQANVIDTLCIQCGTCVHECPQKAKLIVSEIDKVKELIASGRKVACSIAPSFPAAFPGWRARRIPSALRRLGFCYVSETAEGASLIAEASIQTTQRGRIFTACPAVVNYVELYRPEHIDCLVDVVSPMLAHTKMLREKLGSDVAVVFIGPCAAKKQEAKRTENRDYVQAVLTFSELLQWFEEEEIDLSTCTESDFQRDIDFRDARLFPIEGGMIKTCGLENDVDCSEVIHVSGFKQIGELFDTPQNEWPFRFAEALFCEGGCIGGPGFPKEESIFKRKQAVQEYVNSFSKSNDTNREHSLDLKTRFSPRKREIYLEMVKEEAIEAVLVDTGKANPEDRLNCGTCGYDNCREKAAAIVLGIAEASMCMPQMRRLTQQRMDKIIENSPNGVVILDRDLRIIHMNPAFKKLFLCNNRVLGREISYLVNAEGYELLASGEATSYEAVRTKYGIRYHEMLYAYPNDNQYVGFYSNISKLKMEDDEIKLIKKQTIEQAKKLLDHQVQFAQDLVHYLGRSTAESEALVKRMMELYEDEG